jgi:hypothetical protein
LVEVEVVIVVLRYYRYVVVVDECSSNCEAVVGEEKVTVSGGIDR